MLILMMRLNSGIQDCNLKACRDSGQDPDKHRSSELVSYVTNLSLPEALCRIGVLELLHKTTYWTYVEHHLLMVNTIPDLSEQDRKNAGNIPLIENLPQTGAEFRGD